MTKDFALSFEEGLAEFYRGEVIGEAFSSRLLEASQDAIERLKLAHLMQLETETKAWLRPHMIRAGLPIAEPLEWREFAEKMAIGMASLEWLDKIKALSAAVVDLVRSYEAYAEAARRRNDMAEATVSDFMVDHEQRQLEFFALELEEAELATSLEPLMRQSRYPLPVGT